MYFVITLVVRVLYVILFVTDFMMNRKMKKKDTSLIRELNDKQSNLQFAFYFIVMAGLLMPLQSVYLFVTIPSLIFFFWYTDKEIYYNTHSMYFRGRYFEFKKIKNFTYENKTFEFDYGQEHIKLVKPFLDEGVLKRDIVYRIERLTAKQELKEKRNKR